MNGLTPFPEAVTSYLRLVAREHVKGEDVDDERDAIWDVLTQEERDLANHVVEAVFGELI